MHRRAYSALSWGSDCDELRRGLDLAKKVQQALVNGEGVQGHTAVCVMKDQPRQTPCLAALNCCALRHIACLVGTAAGLWEVR